MDRAIAIQVSRLTKAYDGHTAVSDLSFEVYAGEIFGLLGPNGAGKSTTLRTLITLLTPTSGTASVLGHDTVREADVVRQLIGYVPQERAIDRFLTGREHLELLGALYLKNGPSIAFSPVGNTSNSSARCITCRRLKPRSASPSC